MFQHKLSDQVEVKVYADWFILSLLAGNINAGGFLACQRFVSHVTGFATMSGIFFEQKDLLEAFGMLVMPFFFLIGVMISGYLTEKHYAHKKNGQKYAPVMGLVAALMLFVSIGGYCGWFGRFGDPANIEDSFILLAALCGACGLQNSAITSASGATIRTTHLTGLTTDLGLGIIRSEVGVRDKLEQSRERRQNLIRLITIFSFTCGSILGAFVYTKLNYAGFLVPAVLAAYCAVRAQR